MRCLLVQNLPQKRPRALLPRVTVKLLRRAALLGAAALPGSALPSPAQIDLDDVAVNPISPYPARP